MPCRKKEHMSAAILEKLSKFVELKAQHDALVLEQYVVTDQVIASATTARLEAIDLALVRWEAVYKYEVKALEGLCQCVTPLWQPGLAPSNTMAMATA
jgi:hypothetical protein